jgi:hypothetical protein
MNDDLTDDPTLLASAYLDGDVTDDERARVEGDPELLAEVDRLRSVRFLLGDVEAQAISVREAQLAMALDVWDRLPAAERTGARRDATPAGIDAAAVAGAASVTAPTPINGRRRTTSTRWLTGAAAALVLVLAGGVALQLGTGGDDDSASTDDAGSEATEALTATGPADAPAAVERAPAADGQASDVVAGELDTGVGDPPPPGEDVGLDQLRNLAYLADFASAAVGAPRAPDVPAATSAATEEELSQAETFLDETGFPLCLGVDLIVGPAVYGDVPVVVGIDERRNVAIAYRAATCAEVARVRLP